jgi:hypothetical protein
MYITSWLVVETYPNSLSKLKAVLDEEFQRFTFRTSVRTQVLKSYVTKYIAKLSALDWIFIILTCLCWLFRLI